MGTYKVCLDPGHGGIDPGGVNGKRYEKNDALRLALAVRPLLEAQGIETVMTRETDKALSIAQRCALANSAGCNYFLSIHRDAAGPTAYGVSLWVHSRADAATVKKARGILDAVLAVTPTMDRKVQKGSANPAWTDYGVNVQTVMASGLLELGFVTNAQDNRRFEECFNDYAAAIARGVCAALGKPYIAPGNAGEGGAKAPGGEAPGSAEEGGAKAPGGAGEAGETGAPGEKLTPIMGKAAATAWQMRAYLLSKNPSAPDYGEIYLEEGEKEGVRGDIAFAQSCVETGDFRFGGDVKAEQNNFAGMGATGSGAPGTAFSSPRQGIRAQIQHLKAYASEAALCSACVDPRFSFVKRACAPYVEWLGIPENPQGLGWAWGKGYGEAIRQVLRGIGKFPGETQAGPAGRAVDWGEAGDILKAAGVTAIKL